MERREGRDATVSEHNRHLHVQGVSIKVSRVKFMTRQQSEAVGQRLSFCKGGKEQPHRAGCEADGNELEVALFERGPHRQTVPGAGQAPGSPYRRQKCKRSDDKPKNLHGWTVS